MLKQRGMSIVELMIGIAVGLIISVALGQVFVTTTKAKQEVNRMAEQIENGRVAMDFLTESLAHAGFWVGLEYARITPDPALPDICATDLASLRNAVPVYLQGLDDVSAVPGCLSDVKLGTDVLLVRRASTCTIGGGSPCTDAVAPYFQASNCTPPAEKLDGTKGSVPLGEELNNVTTPIGHWYDVADTAAALTLHRRDCGNPNPTNYAERYRYLVRMYYIANNDRPGDGIPTLKMAELRAGAWAVSTIAAGIEQLHFEYGVDDSADGDRTPDKYVTAPATVADWRRVTAIKIHLLSRNTSRTPGHVDKKLYTLGKLADGVTDNSFGPFNDDIRRHASTGLARIPNPTGLRGG